MTGQVAWMKVTISCARPEPNIHMWRADRHAVPSRMEYAWRAIINVEPGSGAVTLTERRLGWSGTIPLNYRYGIPDWDDNRMYESQHPEQAAVGSAMLALRFAALTLCLDYHTSPSDVKVTVQRLDVIDALPEPEPEPT